MRDKKLAVQKVLGSRVQFLLEVVFFAEFIPKIKKKSYKLVFQISLSLFNQYESLMFRTMLSSMLISTDSPTH